MRRPADNPFNVSAISGLAYLPGLGPSPDDVLARLERKRMRGALVGPKGSGKSTLLRAMRPLLERRGMRVRLVQRHEGQISLPEPLRPDEFLLIDSAEQIPFWRWLRTLRLARRAAGILITVHRPGRLPEVARCESTPRLLATLVEALAGTDAPRYEAEARRLFAVHDGDLHRVLLSLYDHWAGRASTAASSMRT